MLLWSGKWAGVYGNSMEIAFIMVVYHSCVNRASPSIENWVKMSHIQPECVYLYINMHDSFLPNSLTEGEFKSGGVDMSPNKSSCSTPLNRVEKKSWHQTESEKPKHLREEPFIRRADEWEEMSIEEWGELCFFQRLWVKGVVGECPKLLCDASQLFPVC